MAVVDGWARECLRNCVVCCMCTVMYIRTYVHGAVLDGWNPGDSPGTVVAVGERNEQSFLWSSNNR